MPIDRHSHHTPAPWIAYEELLTPNGLHVAGRMPMVRSNGHIVANVCRFIDARINHAVCQEAEANGRLISKAPDMLAYVARRAAAGDQEAQALLRELAEAGRPHDGGHRWAPDLPSS
jgi:hypothetical protein